MAHLVIPSVDYKESYLAALKEYQSEGMYSELNAESIAENFSEFIQQFKDQALGINLPKNYVPQTVLWLVEGTEYIGRVSIRHILNDYLLKEGGHIGYDIRPSQRKKGYGKQILQLSLPYAQKLNLEKALITCNETNIGSRKIIEANGGELENIVQGEEGKPNKMRFWITLT